MTTMQSTLSRRANDRERSLWILHRLAPSRGVGNLGVAVRVDAELRLSVLRTSLRTVLARHPEFQETFADDPNEILIWPTSSLDMIDIEHRVVAEEELPAAIENLCTRPFGFDCLMVRVGLLRVQGGSVLSLVLHRLVADRDRAEWLMIELAAAYETITNGARVSYPSVQSPRSPGRSRQRADSVRYWLAELSGFDPRRLPMVTACQVPVRPAFACQHLKRALGPEALSALVALRTCHRTDDTVVLLATYAVLLAQHGCGPDLVVGVVARPSEPEPTTIGTPVHTLPIRIRVDPDAKFSDILRRAHHVLRRGIAHADVSFDDLSPADLPHTADWRTPLLRHVLDVRGPRSSLHDLRLAGQPAQIVDAHCAATALDLELTVKIDAAGVLLDARFSTEIHTATDIAAFLERFEELLSRAQGSIVSRPCLSASDRALVDTVNATRGPLPVCTVAEMVLGQARRTPDLPAVDGMTYRQLVASAGAIREQLLATGIGPGEVVGIVGARGGQLVAAMLGVWTAGAAYLPLGDRFSPVRLRQQMDGAGVSVMLRVGTTNISTADECRLLDMDPNASAPIPEHWPIGHAAYVLFTSGSSGRPKGVAVPHSALANLVSDMAARLGIAPGTRVLWSTSVTFDISALEVFTPLVRGAQVVTAPADIVLSPQAFLEFIEQRDVDVVQGTPTLWQHVAPALGRELSGRQVLVGGECLTQTLAGRLVDTGALVRNMYGPTETTIWSTTAALNRPLSDPMPIGLPISNTQVYVMNPYGRQVFPGLPGELCIAGAGVATEYVGDATRTADRFVDDPVIGRHYRTGDRVRQRPDGCLEYLGREDRQVKVRGHRVELAEVEAVLDSHPAVAVTAVVTETDPVGRLRLAAAVRAVDCSGNLVQDLQRYAATRLPHAAVPARIAVLPAIPTTSNGKVDYAGVGRALAATGRRGAPEHPSESEDVLLRELVDMWRQELGDHSLSVHANYFQHGGYATKALEFADRISRCLGSPVPFDAVFSAPTPEAMRKLLVEAEPS